MSPSLRDEARSSPKSSALPRAAIPEPTRANGPAWRVGLALSKWTMLIALLGLLVAYPGAFLAQSFAVEVQPIRPWDEALVEFNKFQFAEGDWDEPVLSIYGAAHGDPVRVLFVDQARLLRPAEAPQLALLPKQDGEHLFQAQTLFYFAKLGSAAAGALMFAGALGWFLTRRRLTKFSAVP